MLRELLSQNVVCVSDVHIIQEVKCHVCIQFQGAKSDQLVRLDVCQLPCIMFVCLSSFQIIAGINFLPPFKLYVGE